MDEIDLLLNSAEDISKTTEQSPETGLSVIRQIEVPKAGGESIAKLVKNRWYITSDTNILDLSDDLTARPDIQAVGIIEETGKIGGIIIRRDLFDLLGRPFGREVMRRESVEKVTRKIRSFFHYTNIFSVSEILDRIQSDDRIHYYPLKTREGYFAGIFSSQDMLIYLSSITREDIDLASTIQSRIVKEFTYYEDEHLEYAGSSTMAKGVGGDFYAEAKYSNDQHMFCLCDVSGKGMAASLVTTALWGSFSTFDYELGIKRLVKTLNQVFVSTFELQKYVTGVFIQLDPSTGELLLADMGHGHSYLIRKNSMIKLNAGERNMPVGVVETMNPEIGRLQLQPGDDLLFFTDGLIEQKNDDNQEYGLAPVQEYLTGSSGKNLKTRRIELLEGFHAFRNQTPLHDDVSLLMIRYKG